MPSLVVGGPWHRKYGPEGAQSALRLIPRAAPAGFTLLGVVAESSFVEHARTVCLARALRLGADWFLSIDSDVDVVDPVGALRMVSEAPRDAVVVGAVVAGRDGAPCVVESLGVGGGLGRYVECVGFGCVAFRLAWYREHWPVGEPYYRRDVVALDSAPDGWAGVGEDYTHCRRVRSLGGAIWADARVRCRHDG